MSLFEVVFQVPTGRDTMKQGQQSIPGPTADTNLQEWLTDLRHWRDERLFRLGYGGGLYCRPELLWTQRSFVQAQMMVEERKFYDPTQRSYTVDRYLDDLEGRYGGLDSVLIWPTYPNIGIDERNQFDLLRDMPGGLDGLRGMIADFHRRGVRVLFPVMPWDHGTRDEGISYWTALAQLLASIGADAVNGDTLFAVPRALHEASEAVGWPLALEPENPIEGGEALQWNTMSWGGQWDYTIVPPVNAYKWLESRHMVHLCRRWERDKTDDLHFAFFNGCGFQSWENVWGVWNGIRPRDGEALRRIATIDRMFADLLVSSMWVPHVPTLQYGVFASQFPGATQTLWTVINRNEFGLSGRQLSLPFSPSSTYLDVWRGEEARVTIEGSAAIVSLELEPMGFGAVLALDTGAIGPELHRFLECMRGLSATSLQSFDREWRHLPQRQVEIQQSRRTPATPAGMLSIPAATYEFKVSGIAIEGGTSIGVDVQYPWEDSPRRHHRTVLQICGFAIDRVPVTNAAFHKFIEKSGYAPLDAHNFLRDWQDGQYPCGWANKPVTWVSIEDARAYAAWAGKRLPREWEWQYAAQGLDGRRYPWGNNWRSDLVPPPEQGRGRGPVTDVGRYPEGASPFGVLDLVATVWQWTDEFEDSHTRAAVVRGGSYYQPQGSGWYFPQAYRLDQHGKYLLMAPSRDRSGTIGFRCVVDCSADDSRTHT